MVVYIVRFRIKPMVSIHHIKYLVNFLKPYFVNESEPLSKTN